MGYIYRLFLGVLLAVLLASCERKSTVTIRPDGSCQSLTEMTFPRAQLEAQLRQMDMMEEAGEEEEEEDEDEPKPPAEPAKKEEKPDEKAADAAAKKDAELEAQIRKVFENRSAFLRNLPEQAKLDKLGVTKETVQVSVSVEYPSLEDMFSDPYFIEQNGPSPWRMEKDEQGRLKVSITPGEMVKQQGERGQMVNYLMQNKMKMAFLLKLPGKVISSTLPATDGATTSYSLDASTKEGAEAYLKLATAPIVVVAELGGLKLDEPVESADPYARRGPREVPGAILPIVDAGPGWSVTARTVTTTTVYYFPGGREALLGPEGEEGEDSKPGVLIQARLNAPKGRFLQSLAKAAVEKAEDDKGRKIEGSRKAGAGEEEEDWEGSEVFGRENEDAVKMDFTLRLGAPAPDATAVEKLDGTIEAVSFGGWKDHHVPSPAADPKKEIDLSELVPGAKLVILKASSPQAATKPGRGSNGDQRHVRVRLTGPAEISGIAVRLTRQGDQAGRTHSYANDRSSRRKGQQTVREIDVQYQSYGEDNSTQPLTLQVRIPKDVKRERVKFKLEGMDLF
jgi:hypothetical protein